MKSVVTAFGTFRNGRVELNDDAGYRRDLAQLKAKDGAALMVKVSRATRSDKANAYYWSTVLKTLEEQSESGMTDVEFHDAYCEMFLPTERRQHQFYNRLTGEQLTVTTQRRSSALSGGPFYDFVERVRDHARTFFGIETPDPSPDYWRKRSEAAA